MAKIPFDIKFKPQIESGEYKVVTTKEQSVRIICWDRNTTYWKIVALVLAPDGKTENPFTYDVNGNESDGCLHNHELDLFIVTPEPEMTVFEKKVYAYCDGKTVGEELIKRIAKELLSLARDQFIKEGYVIEKKAFHDAVEKVASEVMKEVSDKVDMEEALGLGYEKGRADALKDLPRWKKGNIPEGEIALRQVGIINIAYGVKRGGIDDSTPQTQRYILISELEKLPGFNED